MVDEDSGLAGEWLVDEIEDQEKSADWLFSKDRVHQISIELPDESIDNLEAVPWEYTEGSVTIDGQEVDSVGVRLRGKVGSFRDLSGKPKWKIDFNRYVDGQRFHGLEALSMNNMVVDCSYMKEAMAAEVLAELDVPGSRVAFTRLEVNGDDYGLMLIMEAQDDRFLKRQFPEPDGNLYDAKYVYYWETGDYVLLDFGSGVDEYYQLEEGEDVDHEDVKAISNALLESYGQSDFYETVGDEIHWERVLRGWSAEMWLGQNDGYALNRNNTRLYFNPETDRAEQILWDFDYSFLRARDWSYSWSTPTGALAYWCREDETCDTQWRELTEETADRVDAMGLDDTFDEYMELVEDDIDDDRKGECSWSYINYYQELVDDWIDTRSDTIRTRWGPE